MHVNVKPAYIFSTLLSILLFTASTSYSQDYTIVKLFNSSSPTKQPFSVQINDNGYVVWICDDEIFLYDGSVRQLTDNDDDKDRPQINDNGYVVWEASGNVSGGDYEIWLYDGTDITQLTDNGDDYDDVMPQINDSGYVVWQGYDGSDFEIFLYNGSEVRQLTDNSTDDVYPQINNSGEVVWRGFGGSNDDIWLYDGTDTTQLTDNGPVFDHSPQINNSGEVVWVSNAMDLDYEIWLYDGTDTTLIHDSSNYQVPEINDIGYVVWQEDYDTFLYDGSGVTQLTDGDNGRNPQMNNSGDIVWSGDDGSGFEFFLYDGSSVTQLTNINYASPHSCELNDNCHIVWVTARAVFYAYPYGDDGPDGIADEIGADEIGADEIGDDGGGDDGGGDDGGGDDGGGEDLPKAGVFGAISINDVIGYHLDAIKKDGTRIYMPVTKGYKALKGAQTHIESLSPAFANMIRGGFDSLEGKAEANKEGGLYWIGTHLFPSFGKIAEFYLDAVDSEDLMTNAYSDTMISATEFDSQRRQGIAICPHVVADPNRNKL